jgi:hypothetical protein
VVELVPYGGLPELLLDMISKGLNFFPRKLAVALRPLHTAVSVLSKTKASRKLSERTRSSLPSDYVLCAQKM